MWLNILPSESSSSDPENGDLFMSGRASPHLASAYIHYHLSQSAGMCLTMKETYYTRPIPLEVKEETNSGWKNQVYNLFSRQHLEIDPGRD